MASQPKSNLPAVRALLIEENASIVLKEIPATFVTYLNNTGYIFTINNIESINLIWRW